MSSEKYSVHYEKPKDDYQSYTNTSFGSADSPVVLDVFGDLERLTYNGEIDCDGAGSFYVALSSDGTNYGDNVLVKAGDTLDIETHRVWKIKLTWIAGSAYRVRVY